MPENNLWQYILPQHFHYKRQDYQNSCFSACLQIILANFNLIAPNGRIIEDDFNNYVTEMGFPTLDEAPPALDIVDNYILARNYPGHDHIGVNLAEHIDNEIFHQIQENFGRFPNHAIIGAINDVGGHALALVKTNGRYYGINPQYNNVENYNQNPIELIDNQAILIPGVGAVEFCYQIHRQLP